MTIRISLKQQQQSLFPVCGGVVTGKLKVGGASEEKEEVVKNTSRGWKQTTDSG